MGRLLMAVLMVLCFTGNAVTQECGGEKECAAEPTGELLTLEQLEAAQSADMADMQKIVEKYQAAIQADEAMRTLRSRTSVRAGMIEREKALRKAGRMKKEKKRKK